jgi:putative pyruvate formate lyase activating enzyme
MNPETGREVTAEKLCTILLSMEQQGCHNINFVTPTHVSPSIAEAVALARNEGSELPVVYNCGGYELPEVLQALEETVDIYMPDFKFLDPERSKRLLNAPDYPDRVKEGMIEMDRQKGKLQIENGVAINGLLIRHLVMPGGYQDTERIIDFISQELTPGTAVNIMGQYRPCHNACIHKDINGYPDQGKVRELKEYALSNGLTLQD